MVDEDRIDFATQSTGRHPAADWTLDPIRRLEDIDSMASAVCPYCNEPAYSSVEFKRPWTCPTCGKLVIPNMNENGHKSSGFAKDPVIDQYSRYWFAD